MSLIALSLNLDQLSVTPMKSAYELAMERLNRDSPMAQLSQAQKEQLSDLDSRYAAKAAEKELFLKGEMDKALQSGDLETHDSLKMQLATEKKVLLDELESKKEQVRQEGA